MVKISGQRKISPKKSPLIETKNVKKQNGDAHKKTKNQRKLKKTNQEIDNNQKKYASSGKKKRAILKIDNIIENGGSGDTSGNTEVNFILKKQNTLKSKKSSSTKLFENEICLDEKFIDPGKDKILNSSNVTGIMSDSDDSDFEKVRNVTSVGVKLNESFHSHSVKRKSLSNKEDCKSSPTKRRKKNNLNPKSTIKKVVAKTEPKSKTNNNPSNTLAKLKTRKIPSKTQLKNGGEPRTKTRKDNSPAVRKVNIVSAKKLIKIDAMDESDITSILLKMEGTSQSTARSVALEGDNSSTDSEDSEPEDSGWQEVADYQSPVKSQIPDNPIEITLDLPDILKKKKKKKKFDWKMWVERKIRRFQKEVRIGMHKVELLCLLAHGSQQNAICKNTNLIGQAVSLIPNRITDKYISTIDVNGLKVIVKWFKKLIAFNPDTLDTTRGLVKVDELEKIFEEQKAATEKQFVLMFMIILRAMGYDVRLVMSLQPYPLKEINKKLIPPTRKKTVKVRKVKKRGSGKKTVISEDSASDVEEVDKEFRSPYFERSKQSLKKSKTILSSDKGDHGCDVWVEVYLPEESQWICIDCIGEVINKPYEIESTATFPLHYCLSFSNDGSIKDVTPRYASSWLSNTRKLRVDSDWWRATLEVYRNKEEQNDQDDENIKDQLIKRPLPTSIAHFKNHPLYVLQRHLLKFEAIYPNSAIPVGYIRKEPVYARECVHVLHSRENWRKEGKSVKIGEEPYKMVKSRPKWNKPKENPDTLDLQLFGEWQTEMYIPPPIVDGKIPRNEYGNVEFFKPWMLPVGTVHIKVNALNRVAKKLGVDCVPAMVGWDYHGGFSHAMLEGWVVCVEHQEALMAAWEEDQYIQQQREIEKIEKRVLGNWKLLTRGLLIKDNLKIKFNLQDDSQMEEQKEEEVVVEKNKTGKGNKGKAKKERKKPVNEEPATDAALSWPRRQQTEQEKLNDKNKHFAVETM